ncbi:guanylate kinase [Shigella flexneri]
MYDTQVSVSHTTRQPRPGEVHGEHYFFVNHDEFKEMISRDAFLEHAEVFRNCYGTSREAIEQVLATGVNVFPISTGRARSKLARRCRTRGVSLFYRRTKIELDRRLRGRRRTAKRSLQSVWRKLLQK